MALSIVLKLTTELKAAFKYLETSMLDNRLDQNGSKGSNTFVLDL